MIISTSSHNLQLTDDLCEYVEDTLREAFAPIADHVASIDARLDASQGIRGRSPANAVVLRVDVHNQRPFVAEARDENFYAAIRRGAADSARAVNRQLERSRDVIGRRQAGKYLAFDRYSAANI